MTETTRRSDELYIEYLPLSDLRSRMNPENPKDHDIGAISRSMERFGYTMPPAINEFDGSLLAGHGRLDTLDDLQQHGQDPPDRVYAREDDGIWMVPTLRGLSFANKDDAIAYLIADNQLTALGGWKEPPLAMLLKRLAEGDDPTRLLATGFDGDDLAALMQTLTPPSAPEQFPEYGADIETQYCCPKCGYEWSGQPK